MAGTERRGAQNERALNGGAYQKERAPEREPGLNEGEG